MNSNIYTYTSDELLGRQGGATKYTKYDHTDNICGLMWLLCEQIAFSPFNASHGRPRWCFVSQWMGASFLLSYHLLTYSFWSWLCFDFRFVAVLFGCLSPIHSFFVIEVITKLRRSKTFSFSHVLSQILWVYFVCEIRKKIISKF